MSNPTAAEVNDALAAAITEQNQVAPADSAVDAAEAAIAAQRDTANEWIEEIRADILHFTRKMDAASQRRVLRRCGFKFKPYPGEPEEPLDPPADPAPPTPPQS